AGGHDRRVQHPLPSPGRRAAADGSGRLPRSEAAEAVTTSAEVEWSPRWPSQEIPVSFLPAEARALLQRFAGVQRDAERLAKTIEEGQKLLETMLENRFAGIELLAEAWADYELARGEIEAQDLVRKSNPAYSSAEVVR